MHDEIINQLSAYLDGELSPDERARIDAHMAGCAPCRVVLDDLKAIVVTAPYYEGQAPSRDLWAGIQQGIQEQKEVPFTVHSSQVTSRRQFSLGQLIAACLAFAAIAGGSVYAALRQGTTVIETPATVAVDPSPGDRDPSPKDKGQATTWNAPEIWSFIPQS